jgi:uncharacterized protein with PQ loop repeat
MTIKIIYATLIGILDLAMMYQATKTTKKSDRAAIGVMMSIITSGAVLMFL